VVFYDDFSGGMAGPIFEAYNTDPISAAVHEMGGQLKIRLAQGVPNLYAGYSTVMPYDLRGRAIQVKVPFLSTGSSGFCSLEAHVEGTALGRNRLFIGKGPGESLVTYSQPDSGMQVGQMELPYDPAAHLYWRLREAGGTVFFETSPDGVGWSLVQQQDMPLDVSKVRLSIGCAFEMAGGSPLDGAFDDVQLSEQP
jgi:hypothetical protein